MGRVIPAFFQFLDGAGDPLANGWLQFLVSGTNNTNKDTYADDVYQIANANPLQLDAEGRCPNVFGVGDYRIISFVNDPEDEDSPGEMIQMFDPVTAQGTLSASGGSGSVFDTWDSSVTYAIGDIIVRDLVYYRSLINSNLNLDPLLNEFAWEQIDFLIWYNSTVSYEIGNLVFYEDNLWLSLTDANSGNTPSASPAYWRRVASGYKGAVNTGSSYAILSSDREKIIVLTASATSDETFTLPAVDSTLDRFKVAIYNASSYTLTIDATGSAYVWLDLSGEIDITEGCFVELIYHSVLDTWLPSGGTCGPVLGSQNVASAALPVLELYATDINASTAVITGITATTLGVTDITATTLGLTTLNIASDGDIFLGDANEVSLSYTSATTSFDLDVATGTDFNLMINGVIAWVFDATGEFYPASTNSTPNIGTVTDSVDFIYANNISLPDDGQMLLGDGDDLLLKHDGTYSYIDSSSALYIATSTASDITFTINSNEVFRLDSDLDLYVANGLEMSGADSEIRFYSGGVTHLELRRKTLGGVIYDAFTASAEFAYEGTTIFSYVASSFTMVPPAEFSDVVDFYGDATFYSDALIVSDKSFYFGTSQQSEIVWTPITSALTIESSGKITFKTNGTAHWDITSSGTLVPTIVYPNSINIGGAFYAVNHVYSTSYFGAGGAISFGINDSNEYKIDSIAENTTGTPAYLYIRVQSINTGINYRITGQEII